MIDEIDGKILAIIQDNARIPNTEIARQVGMAPSAVLERLRKLEEKDIIQGYSTRINPKLLNYGLTAFVLVRTSDTIGEVRTAKELARVPEIQEVHHVAGEDCFLVKIRAKDTNHLADILRERLGKIKTVRSTRTTIVLDTVKEITTIPIAFERKEKKNER